MSDDKKYKLNYLFVRVFNQILSWEEQSFKDMGISEITLRELHVIEAVYSLLESGNNRMSEIAKYLAITPGSLTTAVNCLVKKGFLERETSANDRRVVKIVPTHRAHEVNALHEQFHKQMIETITVDVAEDDINTVIKILSNLNKFFNNNKISRK
ncbi:MAG: MarR family transcriptional regulator [Clostridia bacterium]|nr:MarR family transcriptional regulator [Clostridia bacterium]